jgi:hypothetical protein
MLAGRAEGGAPSADEGPKARGRTGTQTGRTPVAQNPANPRLWTQWTHQHYKNDEQEADQEKKIVPDTSSASGTLIFLAF